MTDVKHIKPEFVRLSNHPDIKESWVQERIKEDPSILGLGQNLKLKDAERKQPKAGRLDVLIEDPESGKRFEVEIQLGATDESHIIRCIEYWDIERRRFPKREHVAVIAAEEITSRFFNVIRLFNRQIPLIALKMVAVKMDGGVGLQFIKVLDETNLMEEEEETETVQEASRDSWEKWSSKESLTLVDENFKLLNGLGRNFSQNFTTEYIVPKEGGRIRWFIGFIPRIRFVQVTLNFERPEEWYEKFRSAGFELFPAQADRVRFRITTALFDKNKSLLTEAYKKALEEEYS